LGILLAIICFGVILALGSGFKAARYRGDQTEELEELEELELEVLVPGKG